MSDRTALFIALLIVGALAYDGIMQEWAVTMFLARKGLDLIDYLQFWR